MLSMVYRTNAKKIFNDFDTGYDATGCSRLLMLRQRLSKRTEPPIAGLV